MSDKARQQSSNDLSQTSEGDELASPRLLDEEADMMHGKEKKQYDETPSGSVIEESIYEEEQDTARPSLRSNMSSFAAPTKASEAKKNEKIELAQFVKKPYSTKEQPIRPGSVMRQHPASVLGNRRPSLQRRSVTTSIHTKEDDDVVDHSLPSMESQAKKHRGTRSVSLSSVVSDRSAEEEGSGEEEEELSVQEEQVQETKVPEEESSEEQTQAEEVQEEEEPLVQKKKELEEVEEVLTKKEPLERRVEESRAELEGSQQQKSHFTKDITALTSQECHVKNLEAQVATPQDQIESMSRRGTEEDEKANVVISTDTPNIVLEKVNAETKRLQAGLEKAEKQRDEAIMQRETVQQDLQTVKDDAEKLKQKHDKLVVQLQEHEDKIAARNIREPNLSALEVTEAGNKRLRVAVDETRLVLKKKEKELSDAIAYCGDLDDERRKAEEKLENQGTSIKDLCEIVDLVSQSTSQGVDIGVPKLDELSQSLTQASEIERLRIKIAQLIGTFNEDLKKWQDKNEEFERQIANQGSEIIRLEKAMDFQKTELLSSGLQSPMFLPAMQMDRDGFEQYYKRERLKRKDAEQELAKAKELLSHFRPENEKLHLDITKAREELADLRPKADKLEQDVIGWKEDSEEKKSQLEERTRTFETSTAQQMQESLRYIKEYYAKTNEEAHWEVQGLQKKLAALEEERVALKRAFEQAKVDNARLEDGVTRLRKRDEIRNAHIGKIQQAFMRGAEFPTLPDDDISSPTSTSTISPLAHPLDRVRRPPPIPRCYLPTAIEARNAKRAAYIQELEKAKEQEMFNVSVKPSMSTKNNNGFGRNEIMEKVRKWKMGSSYPPGKPGWEELRRKGAWERWDGEMWAKEFARGRDVDVLRKRGLWNETWV